MGNSKTGVWLQVILGIAVILALPAILIAVMRSAYQSSPEPGKIDSGAFEFLQPAKPASTHSAASAGDSSVTRVYECHANGQVIYSGKPCGPGSIAHDIDVRGMKTDTAPRGECARIQHEIDQINARVRQGNSSAEGEKYRAWLRKLSDRLAELNCGR